MQPELKSDRLIVEGRKPRARVARKQREAPAFSADARPGDKPDREQFEYFQAHFAHYDVLTDLPNRAQFHDRLSARAARQKYLAGILLLNLDHFRSVNVKHGHKHGDALLQQVAERLKNARGKVTLSHGSPAMNSRSSSRLLTTSRAPSCLRNGPRRIAKAALHRRRAN